MTVPSARQVFGPTRRLADWWEPDQVGKPLSPVMAHWLRKDMSKTPHAVQKALARRGLLGPPGWDTPRCSRLTLAGIELRALLGSVPRQYWPITSKHWVQSVASQDEVTCPACGRSTSVELIAWGDERECIACALGRAREAV